MKHTLKQLILSILRIFAPSLKNRASVLMYHSVGVNDAFFTVQSEDFELQLQYIKSRGFAALKLSELVGRLEGGEEISNCAVLTFDDGYKDNYTNVFPLLKKYNIPATIFIITGLIGGEQKVSSGEVLPMLESSEMREMHASGLVEFMPHTVSHRRITELGREEVQRELKESRYALEGMFSEEADIFAYPFGAYNEEVVAVLEEQGFKGAVTVKEGLVGAANDIYRLPRNAVDSATSFGEFKAKLSRAVEIFARVR